MERKMDEYDPRRKGKTQDGMERKMPAFGKTGVIHMLFFRRHMVII
jgi:hypothetical protein